MKGTNNGIGVILVNIFKTQITIFLNTIHLINLTPVSGILILLANDSIKTLFALSYS